jgi:pyrimidine operon attenuation protein/uracil phosphoribosyltransferase
MQVILTASQLQQEIKILADQLIKAHASIPNVVYIGIQQGGVAIADKIIAYFKEQDPGSRIEYGQLDITFYRDDIRNEILAPDRMNLPFSIENKIVVLIDDVLFTGRTIKAALDVLLDYGRPAKVELCVLIDRKEHRQFPIQADFIGRSVNTAKQDKVKLLDGEVVLIQQ